MNTDIKKEGKFEYVETGAKVEGKVPLLLLHGLMGALSNFESILSSFGDKMNVVIPILPIYNMPLKSLDLDGLVDFIEEFIEYKNSIRFIFLAIHLADTWHRCIV